MQPRGHPMIKVCVARPEYTVKKRLDLAGANRVVAESELLLDASGSDSR